MNTRAFLTESGGPVANHAEFNEGCKYFSVALEDGFAIYTTESCELYLEQEIQSNVRMAKMMASSQIIGILMAEKRLAGDRLVLWDLAKKKEVAAITTANEIHGVGLSKTHIATVFDTSIVLYRHQPKMERVAQYETSSNPSGLCCLGHRKLVLPGRSIGQIQIVDLDTQNISIIPAHTSSLRALQLSPSEEIVASASDKGTLIRLYSSSTSTRLGELRRGVTPAKIFSLAFSPSNSRLVVTSDTNTLHVFELPFATSASHQSRKPSSSSTDPGSLKTDDALNASTAQGNFQKWGSLAKLPFAPRVFTDVYSIASASFDSGRDGQMSLTHPSESSSPDPRTARPKGVAGWVDEQTIVVINAGRDARYERFALVQDTNNKIACIRVGWSRYLVPA